MFRRCRRVADVELKMSTARVSFMRLYHVIKYLFKSIQLFYMIYYVCLCF